MDDKIAALEQENRWLKTVLDAINEGVHMTNEEGVTVFYNHACEKFEGLNREEVVGKKIIEIYDVTEENSPQLNVLRTGKSIIEHYHQYHTFDGKKVDVIASTYPYYEKGKAVGVYSVNRDVTKMKEFLFRTIELQKKLGTGSGKKKSNGTNYRFEDIIGASEVMQQVIKSAKKIARNNSAVLIYGETGTGKELFAQSIHNGSFFAEGPFIPINCAAIPETLLESLLFGTVKGAFTGSVEAPGLFEQAENGTLFLDEIDSMSLHLQAKFLRVIQEKTVRRIGDSVQRIVNCRIISATNKEPLEAVKDRLIRQDLYYRLSAVILQIAPLRERGEDLMILAAYFLKKYNKLFGSSVEKISDPLKEVFLAHSWPGNVRELENAIESALNIADTQEKILGLEHLPLYLRKRFTGQAHSYQALVKSGGKLNEILHEVEKRVIEDTLKKNGGNISQTAQELGIFRQALQYRIKRFNIDVEEVRQSFF